mmetsp:Transcript_10742/g.13979  ORF Transcript_10742/g.13979 Transcript_10742/m.13979 type:complete len:260 (+) Transcript_10742:704-1483(+)
MSSNSITSLRMLSILSLSERNSSAIFSSRVLIFSISWRRFSFSCRNRAMVICEVSSCFSLNLASSFISSSLSADGMLCSASSPWLICSNNATIVSWVFIVSSTMACLVSSNFEMNAVISASLWERRSYLVLLLSPPSLLEMSEERSWSWRRWRAISSLRARPFWSSSAMRRLSSFTLASTRAFASRGSMFAISCSSRRLSCSFFRRISCFSSSLYSSRYPCSRISASCSCTWLRAWSSCSCCSCARFCSCWARPSRSVY